MNFTQDRYPVVKKTAIAKDTYELWVRCGQMAKDAACGQFVHIRVPGFSLRRPISICDTDPGAGLLRLVFEIRGEGTKALSRINEGDLLDLLGPLGHGFTPPREGEKAVFVGGGIGVPPLLMPARAAGHNGTAILGFRSAGAAILCADFERAGTKVSVATDDGTLGHHGFVTDLLARHLKEEPCGRIYACGPKPMLQKVAAMAREHGAACEISLEERMGCGVGACLVCACRIKRQGSETYLHVCKDGPVFDAEEVVFE